MNSTRHAVIQNEKLEEKSLRESIQQHHSIEKRVFTAAGTLPSTSSNTRCSFSTSKAKPISSSCCSAILVAGASDKGVVATTGHVADTGAASGFSPFAAGLVMIVAHRVCPKNLPSGPAILHFEVVLPLPVGATKLRETSTSLCASRAPRLIRSAGALILSPAT